jgi:MoxR-like ATPase
MQDAVPKVRMEPSLLDYILDLVEATRRTSSLHLGVSPRGALALTQAAQASALFARARLCDARRREAAVPCRAARTGW